MTAAEDLILRNVICIIFQVTIIIIIEGENGHDGFCV